MHDETATGLPGLLTGKYRTAADNRTAFGMSLYGEESYLIPYVNANCPIFFTEDLHSASGYTNRLRRKYTNKTVELKTKGLALWRSTTSIPYFSMCDIVLIRLAPYVLKNIMLDNAIKSVATIPPDANATQELFTYSVLANADYSSDPKKMLGQFHTRGTHPPIFFDRDGNKLNPPRYDREALADGVCYTLKLLGRLFDTLRDRGIYDISTIIVAADHGCRLMKDGNYPLGYESSILWIKPKGNSSPFVYDDAPTSNCKISGVVKELLNRDLSIDEMKKMLVQDERVVRGVFHGVTKASLGLGKVSYTDWIYGPDGKLLRKEHH